MNDYANRNLTMMTDLYQLTMMYSFYKCEKNEVAVFDMFFRKTTQFASYSIFAGLEQVINYIENLHFTKEDIEYLREQNLFDEDFFDYLKDFKFTGEIYSMEEGTVVFPNEPLLRVKAPIVQAQFIETAVLNILNFQTLIASKASHIVLSTGQENTVMEFGLRRAQSYDAGFFGARAAYIGGCSSTSNVIAGKVLGIPISGTHSHSYVLSFDSELEAFNTYCEIYPDNCILLVDTYNTLKSGVPNAIKAFKKMAEKGHKPTGIRIDSGDLAYLSKKAREMLDKAGLQSVKIFASCDLDEQVIADLRLQGAKIDGWGVGTRLITSWDNPALGGVYKLAACEKDGELQAKMKVSDNIEKTTNPGVKKVIRLFSNGDNKAIADIIALDYEQIDETKPFRIYDSIEVWKSMEVENFHTKELLVKIFENGKRVYNSPNLLDIKAFAKANLDEFWDEYKRLKAPHKYKVDLSDELYHLKKDFLRTIYNKF